jgi:hypothetical protein
MINASNHRALTLTAAAIMASALSGCTVRAGRPAQAYHPTPPPAQPAAAPAQAAAPAAPAAPAQAGAPSKQPQLLGARWVTFRAEKDTIIAAHRGRFSKLRLHVSGSPLEMYNVRVTFGDGSRYSPPTRLVFAQGGWTRVLDLPGHQRHIRKIEFWYRSRGPRTGRANVQVFGI